MHKCEASKFTSRLIMRLRFLGENFSKKQKIQKIWRKNAKKVKKSAFYAFFNYNSKFR